MTTTHFTPSYPAGELTLEAFGGKGDYDFDTDEGTDNTSAFVQLFNFAIGGGYTIVLQPMRAYLVRGAVNFPMGLRLRGNGAAVTKDASGLTNVAIRGSVLVVDSSAGGLINLRRNCAIENVKIIRRGLTINPTGDEYEAMAESWWTEGQADRAWAQATDFGRGELVSAGGNVYVARSEQGTSDVAGTGPSGTGTGITDGTVTWDFQFVLGSVTSIGLSADVGQGTFYMREVSVLGFNKGVVCQGGMFRLDRVYIDCANGLDYSRGGGGGTFIEVYCRPLLFPTDAGGTSADWGRRKGVAFNFHDGGDTCAVIACLAEQYDIGVRLTNIAAQTWVAGMLEGPLNNQPYTIGVDFRGGVQSVRLDNMYVTSGFQVAIDTTMVRTEAANPYPDPTSTATGEPGPITIQGGQIGIDGGYSTDPDAANVKLGTTSMGVISGAFINGLGNVGFTAPVGFGAGYGWLISGILYSQNGAAPVATWSTVDVGSAPFVNFLHVYHPQSNTFLAP